jgi:hypothetical protein
MTARPPALIRCGIALTLLLALLVQLLAAGLPGRHVAAAGSDPLAGPVVICTADGTQRLVWPDGRPAAPEPGKQAPAPLDSCPICLSCASSGCAAAACVARHAELVVWPELAGALWRDPAGALRAPSRIPLRPPGRAPPAPTV